MDRVESNNLAIEDSYTKAESVFSKYNPSQVAVGISGGADSDIVLDICQRFDQGNKFRYCFFDTGMEMNATRRHLDYLEDRYGVKIERVRAYKSVPQSVREYGVPFISKYASEQIRSLQKHDFPFVDGSLEELHSKYPNVPLSVLKWWTNWYAPPKRGHSAWNINRNKYLKEFLIQNPPTFKIAPKCCTYAKKRTASKYYKDNKILLSVTGIRKSEGGVRAIGNKCFTDSRKDTPAVYRPIFWYTNSDKEEYNKLYNIVNSDAYTKYGFVRTGCTGCPFNVKREEEEEEVVKANEPLLYRACQNVFGQSHRYTRAYKEFRKQKETEHTCL